MTAKPRCPICNAPVTPPDPSVTPPQKSWFPFCSERCKWVDLDRWLTGQYAIPGDRVDEQEETLAPPVTDPDEPAE